MPKINLIVGGGSITQSVHFFVLCNFGQEQIMPNGWQMHLQFVSIDIHANIPQAQIFEDCRASVKSKTYILCELLL
jgi:hypothetical protein